MNEQIRMQGFSFLPPVVKNLLIINFLFFFGDLAATRMDIDLVGILGLHYPKSALFQPWQYISYLFMHGSFSHLFFNMFALWMFGYSLENVWGSKKFLFYYLVTGIGAGISQNVVLALEIHNYVAQGYSPDSIAHFMNNAVTIGASGAVFGILLAFGMMFPNNLIYIYFLIPIKAKWFVIIYGLIELFAGVRGGSDVAHFAHLGGMLFGLILILIWKKKAKRKNDFH